MAEIISVLKAVAPGASPAFLAASGNLGSIMARYGITSTTAQAMVIAQCAHESGFKTFKENMKYTASRLCAVWPSRFPTVAAAKPYAMNERALANFVYNGRMGNRVGTDDGYNYRGSAILQHTGRSEFERVERRTGLPVVAMPNDLRNPANAEAMWHAACTYFVDRNALASANAGNVEANTIKVNGGKIGLADRKIRFARAMAAFDGVPLPKGKTTVEQADDSKRTATPSAPTPPPPPPGTGGASKQTGQADWSLAIGIGIAVTVVIVVVAAIFWRKYQAKQAEVERMQLKSIENRMSMTPISA